MRKDKEMILVAMAPANCSPFTPVQIQKLMFLIDEELAEGLGRKFSTSGRTTTVHSTGMFIVALMNLWILGTSSLFPFLVNGGRASRRLRRERLLVKRN